MKRLLTFSLCAVLLAACNRATAPTPETQVPVQQTEQITETMQAAPSVTINLDEQSSSGQSGTATLEEVDGKVKVTIVLDGTVSASAQPAHIHTGSCPTPGAVLYPLTDVVSGQSETVLDVNMASIQGAGALAINVHKSVKESKVYTACGNLATVAPQADAAMDTETTLDAESQVGY